MSNRWQKSKDKWLKETTLSTELSIWAIESIDKHELAIENFEELSQKKGRTEETSEALKSLRRTIKKEIGVKENTLDDLSLSAPNSYKLQVSVPSNLNYLMKAWAASEGRDLSSVALQCLETGLRAMKSSGSIPTSAVKRYDLACEKRIALAEANDNWERHEEECLQNID